MSVAAESVQERTPHDGGTTMFKLFTWTSLSLLAIQFAGCSGGAQEFKNESGKFSIVTPVELKEQTMPVDSPFGKIEFHTFMGRDPDAEYLVSYGDFPNAQMLGDPAQVIDARRDDEIRTLKGRLRNETKIDVNGNPGREISFDGTDPSGTQVSAKTRLFLVRNRLYQIYVGAGRGNLPTDSADAFLRSFKLL
jgi:hypothetical protein